ncbi:histidine phosphatase family protein [Streptomyces sp. NPDC048479]|uniref:SixA phosphatase family protein n=1 Tax=Streptomyces sp. NPDC048479 TaxID=3154725 RepID=UPI003440E573
MTALRRLIVLRHAKSARPPDMADFDRPLTGRGRRDASAAGRWLRDARYTPDLVICSTAVRARETWELAAEHLETQPPVQHEDRVYDADLHTLLAVVRETPASVDTLLLAGHNPGVQELVLSLAAEALGDALKRTREKFPTSAIAVLTWHGDWSELAPGAALLTDMAVPRGT